MRSFLILFFLLTCLFGNNVGATNYKLPWDNQNCWMNSALQCLFKAEPLVTILKNVNPSTDIRGQEEKNILTCDQIKKLSSKTQRRELRKAFLRNFLMLNRFYNREGENEDYIKKEGSASLVNHQRLDAAMRKLSGCESAGLSTTFLYRFLEGFQRYFFKIKKVASDVQDLFKSCHIRRETYTCGACQYSFDRRVSLSEYDLKLPHREVGFPDILRFGGLRDSKCVKCKVPVKKKLNYLFKTFPKILIIGSDTMGESAAIPTEVPIPFKLENFDITPILADKTSEAVLYDLFAVMVDEGWHLWALVKDFKNGKWYRHDDYKNKQKGILENVSNDFMKNFATKGVLKKDDITKLNKTAKPAVFFYELRSSKKKVAELMGLAGKVQELQTSLNSLSQKLKDLSGTLRNVQKKLGAK